VSSDPFDPKRDYPLGTRRPDLVSTPGGQPLAEVTLHALRDGRLDSGEIRATPDTLRLQSEVARAAGREPLAESLERAAELAAVPDELLLAVYTALRPRRATAVELERCAAQLEGHGARRTAAFVREAAAAYADRGLLAHA
jgi:propanediol dehydratase small subunit